MRKFPGSLLVSGDGIRMILAYYQQRLGLVGDIQIGQLLLDIILVNVKQVSREYQSYEDIEDSRRPAMPDRNKIDLF
jgi:hypothetical protein